MAFENLVGQKPYLHSSKWNFYRAVNNLSYGSLNNKESASRASLQKVINELNIKINSAKTIEDEFFRDFTDAQGNPISSYGDTSACAKAWSSAYLLRESPESDNFSQSIYRVVTSAEMKALLLSIKPNEDFILGELKKAFGNNENDFLSKSMINALMKTATLTDALELLLLKDTRKKPTSAEVVKKMSELGFINELKEEIKGNLTSKKGRILSVKRGVKQKFYDIVRAKAETSNLLSTRLLELGYSLEDIKKVIVVWEKILEDELIEEGKRGLTSLGEEGISGAQDEKGSFLGYVDYTKPLSDLQNTPLANIEGKIKMWGSKLSTTISGEEKKEGKIDSVYYGEKTGKPYYIQNKNTLSDIIRGVDDVEALEKLTYNPRIKLHGKIDVKSFFVGLQSIEQNFLSSEDIELLAYLIVNLNALNKFGGDQRLLKRRTVSDASGGSSSQESGIQLLISKILSQGVQVFMTSLYNMENGVANSLEPKTYQFIIYASKYLIPISLILEELKKAIVAEGNRLIRLQVYTGINSSNPYTKDFSEAKDPFRAMRDEEKDYHDQGLIDIGQAQGKKIYDNKGIYFSNIYLNLDIQNIVAKAFF